MIDLPRKETKHGSNFRNSLQAGLPEGHEESLLDQSRSDALSVADERKGPSPCTATSGRTNEFVQRRVPHARRNRSNQFHVEASDRTRPSPGSRASGGVLEHSAESRRLESAASRQRALTHRKTDERWQIRGLCAISLAGTWPASGSNESPGRLTTAANQPAKKSPQMPPKATSLQPTFVARVRIRKSFFESAVDQIQDRRCP